MLLNKLLPIFVLLVVGCGRTAKKHDAQDRIPEPDIVLRLEGQKTEIDSNRMTKNLMARIYAKVKDDPSPVEILDLKWPEHIDEVYNVWYGLDTQIVCVGAYPYSQSGDWDLGLTHYFDEAGKTFAFERNTSFYNSMCTDELAIEQIVSYYYNDAQVDSVYVLTDLKGNTLVKDSCQFPYDFPYRVYTNSHDLLKNLGISSQRSVK